ncbi:hypothetical protein [Rhizobium leguminosarum]|uniref:hypothetical protein n=1 Tax=Rhizobium leguminosarum TaxID=384 RepID=UPI001C943733|nr:hypothetical protein [Rhizobium leguminosarum]MBY5329576.1 hypothetical protein [Rhizobium leguminosarum]
MPATHPKKNASSLRTRGGSVRAFSGLPTTVNVETSSFQVVIATTTPVRRMIPDPRIVPSNDVDCSYIVVDEVIDPKGIDLSRAQGMPLVDSHDTWSGIAKILGKVDNVHVENDLLVGDAMLASAHEYLTKDIDRGFYRQGSLGYEILEAEFVERPDDVPLYFVTRSLVTEYSLVAVGADENSYIRSADGAERAPTKITIRSLQTPTLEKRAKRDEENTMPDFEELVATAEDAVAAADAAISAVDDVTADAGDQPDDLMERARALRGKRAEGDDVEKKDGEDVPAADDEAEKKAVDEVRSIARSYGLTGLVTDLHRLGARSATIRSALIEKIAGKSGEATRTAPATAVQPAERKTHEPEVPSARSIYAGMNNANSARRA